LPLGYGVASLPLGVSVELEIIFQVARNTGCSNAGRANAEMHRLNLGHIAVEGSLTCIAKKMKALYDETSRWNASIGENGLVPSTLRR
jgi:hypothetical protein